MKNTTLIFGIIISFAIVCGCTAITDFKAPSKKIDIAAETSPDLTVSITDDIGEISLAFESDLPEGDLDEISEFVSDSITLLVTNDESGVGVPLTESPVSEPTAVGEYTLELIDSSTLRISFFNESVEGYTLRPGGDYSALLTIGENDYFMTDDVTYEVTVE